MTAVGNAELFTVAPDEVVRDKLGAEWDVVAFSRSAPRDYEAIPRRATSVGEGWNAVHEIAAHAAVERAEPRIETHAVDAAEPPDGARAIFGTSTPDPATEDRKWSPRLVRVFDAWARVATRGDTRSVLVFVGATRSRYYEVDPGLAVDIRARAAQMGLDRRIRFVEATREIEKYQRAADVFALPSVREGLLTAKEVFEEMDQTR